MQYLKTPVMLGDERHLVRIDGVETVCALHSGGHDALVLGLLQRGRNGDTGILVAFALDVPLKLVPKPKVMI